MRFRFLAIAAGLAASAPLAAFAGDAAPVIQAASTVRPGETLLCHYYYHEGVVIRRQECRTSGEWNRIRIEIQAQIGELQRRGLLQH